MYLVTVDKEQEDRGALAEAAGLLARGGIGVIPTDTVYGLAALASSEAAVERLESIKARPAEKPFPIHVPGMRQAERLAYLDPVAGALARRFWPGPLTLVLPRRPGVELSGGDAATIGLRVPDCWVCLALADVAGPLVVPSANFAGEPAPASFDQVSGALLELVDFAIDAGRCDGGVESTVADLTEGIEVLREGAIPAAEVRRIAGAAGGKRAP